MEKILLDTNVILHDPYYINKIQDSEIYIPSVVLEEIDNKKSHKDLGFAVREFGRYVDELHENGYMTDGNSIVHFVPENPDADLSYLGGYSNDNIIIHTAKEYNCKLISDDTLVRVKARTIAHIIAEKSTQEKTENNTKGIYQGYIEHYLPDNVIDTFYKLKFLSLDYLEGIEVYPHMFIILHRFTTSSGSLIGKINSNCTALELIEPISNIWGINPKNAEQLMAMHLLLDKDIPLVTMAGKAGIGKTLLAMAAGLLQINDEPIYDKMVATKPIIDMGKELGTLPGNKEEKLSPYVESYYDALEFIFGGRNKMLDAMAGMQDNFVVDALNYIRGRSLPKQFFVVDEAQNLSKHEIKTIITRMGEDSKIVLMGDTAQIDNRWLDAFNNGLTHVVEKFKDKNLAGHITLTKGVRSGLASMAADIL